MSFDLEGRLRSFSLSDVLQFLTFSGQTGTLTLHQGWNSRTICFEKGRLTYIAAVTLMPTTGELLIRAGKLDPTQLREALAQVDQDNERLPDVLLARRWVTADDLKRCRDQLLEETTYSLFLWRNCRITFESGAVSKVGGLALDLTTERLVIEGTRRVDEWIAISPYVPSMRMTFRRLAGEAAEKSEGRAGDDAPEPSAVSAPEAELTEQDAQVLAEIHGQRDGVALGLACGLTQFETAKSLARLTMAGLARAAPPDKAMICDLFATVFESIYMKLGMFGFARMALEFELELTRFAREYSLQVRAQGGKIVRNDAYAPIDTTALIDLYKLFFAIQQNHFSRVLEPEVVRGLVEGLYLHADPERRALLDIYEFYQIEGLLALPAV